MAVTLEEKVVLLESQLKDVQLTLFKYENRLKDQKMFCDCVAKYFLHKFGFDIWLQLDMLKSALENDSSDSDDVSLFPKSLTSVISKACKRPMKAAHGHTEKRMRLKRDFGGGDGTSSYVPQRSVSSTIVSSHSNRFEQNNKESAGSSVQTAVVPPQSTVAEEVASSSSSPASLVHNIHHISPIQPVHPVIDVDDKDIFEPRTLVKCESDYYDESITSEDFSSKEPSFAENVTAGRSESLEVETRFIASMETVRAPEVGKIVLQSTNKGRPVAVFNGHSYYFKEYSRSLNEMTWRCVMYHRKGTHCEAVLKTVDSIPKNDPTKDHSHLSNEAVPLKDDGNGNCQLFAEAPS